MKLVSLSNFLCFVMSSNSNTDTYNSLFIGSSTGQIINHDNIGHYQVMNKFL